jgi:hypothetical protein
MQQWQSQENTLVNLLSPAHEALTVRAFGLL